MNKLFWPINVAIWFAMGIWVGYTAPRDLELGSMAPVEITYEVTPEAARYLVLKAVRGIEPQ